MHEDVKERFLPNSTWARVYFDHVSEVLVRRVPEHQTLLDLGEFRVLNPAFPPDSHARVLLGRQEGWPQRLRQELRACLSDPKPELYCRLVEILELCAIQPLRTRHLRHELKFLEGLDPEDLKNERVLTRKWVESVKLYIKGLLKIK
mmetsp:Transcript_1160/g.1918  ORF Transcript_1160/g.1918 Transcript_1160/m.1918 type:complete len:147 (-) Transcript_1160:4-444(-)